jgi:aryl-alcohol dehydrogenase-like predicted oxidoreductase
MAVRTDIEDILAACDASLRRLQTDVIDLYQIHWPVRHAPAFGALYFEPRKLKPCSSIEVQLEAMQRLVRSGKVRAIGLSNETPFGLCEFIRVAESAGLPRVATVQNPYGLINRVVDNGLDETMHHRLGVSLLAVLAAGLWPAHRQVRRLRHRRPRRRRAAWRCSTA